MTPFPPRDSLQNCPIRNHRKFVLELLRLGLEPAEELPEKTVQDSAVIHPVPAKTT